MSYTSQCGGHLDLFLLGTSSVLNFKTFKHISSSSHYKHMSPQQLSRVIRHLSYVTGKSANFITMVYLHCSFTDTWWLSRTHMLVVSEIHIHIYIYIYNCLGLGVSNNGIFNRMIWKWLMTCCEGQEHQIILEWESKMACQLSSESRDDLLLVKATKLSFVPYTWTRIITKFQVWIIMHS